MGDLGRVPVPHTNTVSIQLLHKTEKNRKGKTVNIVKEMNCEQEFIRLSPSLTQERMLAGTISMII